MWRFYGALKRMLARRKLPCVVIDIDIKSDLADYVCHDYIGTAKMGIEYLIGLGFKRIHHINSELREGLWADRQKAYETGMKAAGLEKEIRVDYCANSTAAAFRLVRKLLQTNEKPEAFYCANDILAIGAMAGDQRLRLTYSRRYRRDGKRRDLYRGNADTVAGHRGYMQQRAGGKSDGRLSQLYRRKPRE